MYSWKDEKSRWEYALIRDSKDFSGQFLSFSEIIFAENKMGDIHGLKHRISELPRDAVIGWRNSPPSEVQYPPATIYNEIVRFARMRGITVERSETME